MSPVSPTYAPPSATYAEGTVPETQPHTLNGAQTPNEMLARVLGVPSSVLISEVANLDPNWLGGMVNGATGFPSSVKDAAIRRLNAAFLVSLGPQHPMARRMSGFGDFGLASDGGGIGLPIIVGIVGVGVLLMSTTGRSRR
jgi:hypothetical protein